MTDTASAALLNVIEEMRHNVRCPDDGDAGSVWAWRIDEWADQLDAVLASLPAPQEPLYGFPGSSTKLASLPAPAAPEKPNPKDCGATDYPVWGDGSHDTVTCARPAGHEGPHTGLIGAHQWTW